jgi:LPXTG-motif cell wall-anchored protein
MSFFQNIMYGFYALLFVAAAGIGFWFYKKRKENE